MTAPDPNVPDSIAGDLIVGAADLARFIYGSDEPRFQRRIYCLCTVAKLRLPHFRLGHQLVARRSTQLSFAVIARIGQLMARKPKESSHA